MTKLDAVNEIISVLGEDPVTTLPGLDDGTTEGLAEIFLARSTTNILETGWNVNRVKRTLTAANPIVLTDVLAIQKNPNSPPGRLTIRNGNLFDLDNETEEFTVDVVLDLIVALPFIELASSLARYIVRDAALKLLRQKRPTSVSIQTIAQELFEARADWVKIDRKEANLNTFATFHIQEAKGNRRRFDATLSRNSHR